MKHFDRGSSTRRLQRPAVILRELGYDPHEIEVLAADRAAGDWTEGATSPDRMEDDEFT